MTTFANAVSSRPKKGDEILWQPSDEMAPVHGYVVRVGRGWCDVRWVEGVHSWGCRLALPLRDTHTVLSGGAP